MRGKQPCKGRSCRIRRITPAHAGKTLSPPVLSALCADHPRRCGENFTKSLRLQPCAGSPPQVRGKLSPHSQIGQLARITPAGAGKTLQRLVRRVAERDHPRRCGENLSKIDFTVEHVGSPPRMRGKRFYKLITAASGRITPAHAGKTVPPIVKSRHNKDHPRACGENNPPLRFIVVYLGSPPRMRGKPIHSPVPFAILRITPAHAGKTANQ